ncbi:hypothetical protein J6590_051461 [Homalodisca vitripennis]|nr:hypothetical protein J6590_051461 [Homalodisca vitripennis]
MYLDVHLSSETILFVTRSHAVTYEYPLFSFLEEESSIQAVGLAAFYGGRKTCDGPQLKSAIKHNWLAPGLDVLSGVGERLGHRHRHFPQTNGYSLGSLPEPSSNPGEVQSCIDKEQCVYFENKPVYIEAIIAEVEA